MKKLNKIVEGINEDVNINLKNIPRKLMKRLYINSYIDKEINLERIQSLKIIDNTVINDIYQDIGKDIVKNQEYGIVIMAGGNARRLNLNIPKGMLEINYHGKNTSLFAIYLDKIKKVYDEFNIYLNVYIMVNSENELLIKKYFQDNNYFDYPCNKIKFFVQSNLPLLSTNGKFVLKDKSNIWLVPNGNGNVFEALKNYNLISDMEFNNIKYCLFVGIDNPLMNLVDYNFIGFLVSNNYKLASKTIAKTNIDDNAWVFCKYNNRPFILDDRYVKLFYDKKNDEGEYGFREKNIISHLIHIDYIKKFSHIKLKYHRACKYYDCLVDGSVESIKCFKFEHFIYDAFCYAKDMLLYRTDDTEFCPIKKLEDIEKVEKILNIK